MALLAESAALYANACDNSAEFVNIWQAKISSLSLNGATDMMYIKHYVQISSETLHLED